MPLNLSNVINNISSFSDSQDQKKPPVDLWDPPFCGDLDLQIKKDGSWYYNGTPFKRESMVKLFASVLKKEQEKYFLVTPVEKVGIQVEDVPFLITQWQWLNEKQDTMIVQTNLEDNFILDNSRTITIAEDDSLYVNVRSNLTAKIHRNVYYQWLEMATIKEQQSQTQLYFTSANQKFIIGVIDND